jgi:hypothetical protein
MTWLAFRTQRAMVLSAVVVVAIVAVWLAVTGSSEQSAHANLLHHGCLPIGDGALSDRCLTQWEAYNATNHWNSTILGILYVVPAALGLLLGAPLVAWEIERGTNRLAWTQSISRTRWALTKLAVGGLITALIMGLLVPLVDWWIGAAQEGPQIYPRAFDVAGIVPIAYALFAFVLGAALGAIIRRTAWSIAAGVPLFVGLRFVLHHYRYHLAPLRYLVSSPSGVLSSTVNNDWVTNIGLVPRDRLTPAPGQNWNSLGNRFDNCLNRLVGPRPGNASAAAFAKARQECASSLRLHYVVQYQPASHFWPLQGVESAIVMAVASLLLGVTVLAVRRWWT